MRCSGGGRQGWKNRLLTTHGLVTIWALLQACSTGPHERPDADVEPDASIREVLVVGDSAQQTVLSGCNSIESFVVSDGRIAWRPFAKVADHHRVVEKLRDAGREAGAGVNVVLSPISDISVQFIADGPDGLVVSARGQAYHCPSDLVVELRPLDISSPPYK